MDFHISTQILPIIQKEILESFISAVTNCFIFQLVFQNRNKEAFSRICDYLGNNWNYCILLFRLLNNQYKPHHNGKNFTYTDQNFDIIDDDNYDSVIRGLLIHPVSFSTPSMLEKVKFLQFRRPFPIAYKSEFKFLFFFH